MGFAFFATLTSEWLGIDLIAELSAPNLVNQPSPERPSKLEIQGVSNKSGQQPSEYRKVSLGSPMGPSSSRLLLEQASPRPFRKVVAGDDGRGDHEPLSKSRKESAHSSPSKSVAIEEPPQRVRIATF